MLQEIFNCINRNFKKTTLEFPKDDSLPIKFLLVDAQNTYGVEYSVPNKLLVWINFFIDEVNWPKMLYRNWASCHMPQTIVCGNCYCLTRWNGKVYLGYAWDDVAHDKNGNIIPSGEFYEFPITIENFIKLYDEWMLILKDRHLLEHIVIKEEDDGSISFGRIYKKPSKESTK